MELIIQKAVELGAYQIVPVAAHRSVVKLDEKKAAAKVSRWQAIAESAAKQSRRGVIPQVQHVMSWEQALAHVKDLPVKLIPYELAEDMGRTREILENLQPGQDIAVFIGPEGGFEERGCVCHGGGSNPHHIGTAHPADGDGGNDGAVLAHVQAGSVRDDDPPDWTKMRRRFLEIPGLNQNAQAQHRTKVHMIVYRDQQLCKFVLFQGTERGEINGSIFR